MNQIPIAIGQVIAGRYRIERILGQGGMGVVAAARHLDLDEMFALKVMLPDAFANQEAVERFVREARTAAKLRSLHAAKVIDSGRLPNGAPYLAMEYLQGNDLEKELQTRGPLPIEEIAAYGIQVCDVLSEAHAAGIVHRDLKPANLFLTRLPNGAPCLKVLDFGIAKQVDPFNGASMTQTTSVFGTPVYMSPEQMKSSKSVDARSDLWSLGVVLYELCTGAVPYDGESMTSLVAQVMTEPPVPIQLRRPGLPLAFQQVVMCCLERRPEARYQSAAQLAAALAPFAAGRARMPSFSGNTGTSAMGPPGAGSGQPFSGAPTQVAARWNGGPTQNGMTSTHRPAPRPKGAAIALFGMIAVLAAVGLFLVARSSLFGSQTATPAGAGQETTPVAPASSLPAATAAPSVSALTVVEPPATDPSTTATTPPAATTATPQAATTATPQAATTATPQAATTATPQAATTATPASPGTSKPATKPTPKPTPSSTKPRGGFL